DNFSDDGAATEKREAYPLPSAEEFRERRADCWYHAVWTAKKLRRGEVWTAKSCLDGYLKRECLLPMLGWHTRARHGREPWYEGRFLEEWADDRALADLRGTFADYDAEDCWRALFETTDCFEWVADEVADELGYDPDLRGERRSRDLLAELYDGRE
ncbi:aminoglycoside 6-adenylyltransferase, partial [Halorussus sp. GCM10023401]